MAEFKLVGFASQRKPGELMAQANPEDRHAPHEFANGMHRIIHRLWVSGAVGKKDSIRLQLETSSALVSAGTTVTRHPSRTNMRRMLSLIPKS